MAINDIQAKVKFFTDRHRQWWRLQMSEKFSSGMKTSKQTDKQTNKQTLHVRLQEIKS